MQSHTQSASHLEASSPSTSPETAVVTADAVVDPAYACDPVAGVHVPGCRCTKPNAWRDRR